MDKKWTLVLKCRPVFHSEKNNNNYCKCVVKFRFLTLQSPFSTWYKVRGHLGWVTVDLLPSPWWLSRVSLSLSSAEDILAATLRSGLTSHTTTKAVEVLPRCPKEITSPGRNRARSHTFTRQKHGFAINEPLITSFVCPVECLAALKLATGS